MAFDAPRELILLDLRYFVRSRMVREGYLEALGLIALDRDAME